MPSFIKKASSVIKDILGVRKPKMVFIDSGWFVVTYASEYILAYDSLGGLPDLISIWYSPYETGGTPQTANWCIDGTNEYGMQIVMSTVGNAQEWKLRTGANGVHVSFSSAGQQSIKLDGYARFVVTKFI